MCFSMVVLIQNFQVISSLSLKNYLQSINSKILKTSITAQAHGTIQSAQTEPTFKRTGAIRIHSLPKSFLTSAELFESIHNKEKTDKEKLRLNPLLVLLGNTTTQTQPELVIVSTTNKHGYKFPLITHMGKVIVPALYEYLYKGMYKVYSEERMFDSIRIVYPRSLPVHTDNQELAYTTNGTEVKLKLTFAVEPSSTTRGTSIITITLPQKGAVEANNQPDNTIFTSLK